MKIAVMQPYFFPYLGYFSLIQSVDYFMFFDDVQYIRKSWMSRNRLLNIEKEEPFYIRPDLIKPDYKALLPTVKLDPSEKWKAKMMEQLNGYNNKAPFVKEVRKVLEQILSVKYDYLVDFNMASIKEISSNLNFKGKFDKYTDHNFWFEEKPNEGDWGRLIAKELNASHYINATGGESFIKVDQFIEDDIALGFIQPSLDPYDQGMEQNFIPALSIIDVLLFNGFEKTESLVKNYKVKWKN